MVYVRPEVIAEARKVDLLSYLQATDPNELVKCDGNEYCTRTHDSLKLSNGKWFWWSRGIGGASALDYLVKVRGVDFVTAVEAVMGKAVEIPSFIAPEKKRVYDRVYVPRHSFACKQAKKYLLDRGIDEAIIDECMRRTRAHIARNPIPFKPGLMALLTALQRRGIPVAVATGTRRASADDMITRAQLSDYIDAMVCGDEVSACKPDPEIFLKAAALIGVPPQDCIVLEDSLNGILAAHAAGAQPVMIPDTVQPTDEVRALCAHVLTRLDEVIELL
jgi:HAD superfamily hydrolase (TIGR01509 family)